MRDRDCYKVINVSCDDFIFRVHCFIRHYHIALNFYSTKNNLHLVLSYDIILHISCTESDAVYYICQCSLFKINNKCMLKENNIGISFV